MILTYPKKIKYLFLAICLLASLFPVYVRAQSDSLSLSVTPTLFEMAAAPTQEWNSSVKVINNNRTYLTVYAQVVNFAPQGETGQGKFLPVFDEMTDGTTLAEWIDITSEPIVLPPGSSQPVPFTVRVPENASPGGHFAAIMIGTRPPSKDGVFKVQTSQIVTSLFFVRIAGDVIEKGDIRSFLTTKKFLQTPNVNFEVRFENKGNIHIQPQGEILIKNMWGKERGRIPINYRTHFGNVLPNSIRKFEFNWKGEPDFSDIGRYTAVLSLAYGSDNRQFVTRSLSFWVVPVKSVVTVVGSILLLIVFVLWAVRSYVRRMLALQGIEPRQRSASYYQREGDVLIQRRQIAEPVKAGWIDLSSSLKKTKAFGDTIKTLWQFCLKYKKFFLALAVALVAINLIFYFVTAVLKDSRDYEITIENPDTDITISSEEIIYDQGANEQPNPSNEAVIETVATSSVQSYTLNIVNSSDITGAAAKMKKILEPEFEVNKLNSDFGETKERSVIVYHPELQESALALRERLGNFILSALPPGEEDFVITIYIGNDYEGE